jgi:Protein tyrosine and serine/threonine kinase
MNQKKPALQLMTSLPFLLMTCNTIVETCLSVILHQYRFRRLSVRVKAVQAHLTPLFDQTQTVLKNPEMVNFVLLLKTSLEDTLTFSKRFLKNDRKLAIRIFKFGSDEEEFIKLSERIENCITALSLPVDLAIFKHALDDEDFLADCKTLKTHSVEILSLLTAKSKDREKTDRMVQNLAKLVSEQDSVRAMYRNKRPIAADINLDEKDVEYLEVIGAGSFGQVFRGRFKNEVVAIKKLQSGALSSEAIRHFKTEANMMRRLSHPRTLACIGVSNSPGTHCMIVEYMENKSLTDYITANEDNPGEWPYRLDIALDIAVGMSYLHRLQIIHRSLKSANVLLDQNLRVKIADFGMSIARTETATIMKVDEFGKAAQYMVNYYCNC